MRSFNIPKFLFLLIVPAFFLTDGLAQARGILFTVNSIADSKDANPGDGLCADAFHACTLRAAVEEANANTDSRDVIVFALPHPSTIDLTLGELVIASNLSIVGPGARRLIVQRGFETGANRSRIFRVTTGASVNFRMFKIRNGELTETARGGGILAEVGSTTTLTDMWLTQNVSEIGGAVSNAGTMTVNRSLFDNNLAGTDGSAIHNAQTGDIRIFNTTFTKNIGTNKGALQNEGGSVLLVNDTFTENASFRWCADVCNDGTTGTVQTMNSILGQLYSAGFSHALFGTFVSLGNNIVPDSTMAHGFVNGVNSDLVDDAITMPDPMLGELADNGGQLDTVPLLSKSPAIDKGNSCVSNNSCSVLMPFRLQSEQRASFSRKVGLNVDIGAFESGAGQSFGSFSLQASLIGNNGMFGGSRAVLTDVVSNKKRYLPINPTGRIRFQNIPLGFYVFEVQTKRLAVRRDPVLFDLTDLGSLPFLAVNAEFSAELSR